MLNHGFHIRRKNPKNATYENPIKKIFSFLKSPKIFYISSARRSVHSGRVIMYTQPQNQVQNKPTAAYVLSLIGGIFGLLISLAFIALGVIAYMALSPSYYYSPYYGYSGIFGLDYAILIGLGAWMLITSILIIVFASKLKANPMEHSKWGALIIVFSIIGLGGLFGIIGGILALVYKPVIAGAPQQPPPQAYGPQQPITRICPQCGRVVNENVKFCPNCGKQLS